MIVASFLVPGVPVPSALPRQHLDILQDMLADGPQFSLPTDSPKKQQQGPYICQKVQLQKCLFFLTLYFVSLALNRKLRLDLQQPS